MGLYCIAILHKTLRRNQKPLTHGTMAYIEALKTVLQATIGHTVLLLFLVIPFIVFDIHLLATGETITAGDASLALAIVR